MSRTLPRDLATPVLDPRSDTLDPFENADRAEYAQRHWPADPDRDDQLDAADREIDVDARIRRRYAEPTDRDHDCFLPGCVH